MIVIVFFVVMRKLNSLGYEAKMERSQDLFRFKHIENDGLIEMPDGTYRAMIEVEPTNMYLKAPEEQEVIWLQFRDMINSVQVTLTIMIQSRHKEIKTYTETLREEAKDASIPALEIFGEELADWLESHVSEENVKDHRYYTILEVDPHNQSGDLEIPNETVAQVARSFQRKISSKEAEDLARQELSDGIAIVSSYYTAMGLNVYRMDKNAILEMAYSAFNRDLSPVANYETIVESSGTQTFSYTKEAFERLHGDDFFNPQKKQEIKENLRKRR